MNAVVMVVMSDAEVAAFGRAIEPGFGAMRTAAGLLPLAAMDVDARVSGIVASTQVAQTFVNSTGAPIEATYIFPLPDRAAVTRFRFEVGGRVIEGTIDERGKARADYDRAIATGHRAAIAEEERPGVFTMRVGNLMPGEHATVRLSLVGPLPVDDGELSFQFPLVVAQRYVPGHGLSREQAGLGTAHDTNLVPDASRISPPVMLPGLANPVRLSMRVAIEDANVTQVASSLHAVTTSMRDGYVVELQPGERLDRDFILRWRIDPARTMRTQLVCTDDEDGRGGTFMLTLSPPSTRTIAAKPRDLVFVLDRSGSMEGWKMLAARRATARMIDSLSSNDRFAVIAFDDRVEFLPDNKLTHATDRVRYAATEQLAKVDHRGGTEMAEPLRRAANMLYGYDDRERAIVLVTDGQIANEDQILADLTPQLRNIRVFALGIDTAVNAAFLRRLAAKGGGLAELVESEDRLDVVMAQMHRRIGSPIATELNVRGEFHDVAPRRLPDVFAGSPVAIYGRYRGAAPTAIELDGNGFSARVERQSTSFANLSACWARAHIRDLEDRYAVVPDPWSKEELEKQIVATSKHFRVLSRFTAFLAVDKDQIVNPGGRLREVVQPVERRAALSQSIAGAAPAAPMSAAPQGRSMMGMPAGRGGFAGSAPGAGAPPPPASRPAPAPKAPEPVDDFAEEQSFAAADLDLAVARAPRKSRVELLELLVEIARDLVTWRNSDDELRKLRDRLSRWMTEAKPVDEALMQQVFYLSGAFMRTVGSDDAVVLAGELRLLAEPPKPLPPRSSGAFWK